MGKRKPSVHRKVVSYSCLTRRFLTSCWSMRSKRLAADSSVDIQRTLLKLLVKELSQVYDHVDVHPAIIGSPLSTEAEGMSRCVLIRWYDNSPLARIVFAPQYLIVELGPRRREGWQKVVRIRYQDPRFVERILRLLEEAWP